MVAGKGRTEVGLRLDLGHVELRFLSGEGQVLHSVTHDEENTERLIGLMQQHLDALRKIKAPT